MIKLVAKNVDQMYSQLARLDWDFKKPMQLVITQFRRRRTTAQQSKIHPMLRDLANHNDVTEGQMKDWAKGLPCWPGEERTLHGEREWLAKSEAQLTVEEESEIISRLQAIGDEFNVSWSEPS